jgi:hypothetical protein
MDDVPLCPSYPPWWPWIHRLGFILALVSIVLQAVALQQPSQGATTIAGASLGSLAVLSLGVGVALLSASSLMTKMVAVTKAR